LGRIAKGEKCSVVGCNKEAMKSLATEKVAKTGLKVGNGRRSYLCKEHYKEYKKATKNDKKLQKWRWG
jgi:hypothetical protein